MAAWTARWARRCALHPWRVLAAWGAVLVAAIASIGLFLGSALTTDQAILADVESKVGFELIDKRLPGSASTGETVIVRSDRLLVTDPAYEAFVRGLAADIRATGKATTVTTAYDGPGIPALVSPDRHATLLSVRLVDSETDTEDVQPIIDLVRAAGAGSEFVTGITGDATVGRDFLRLSNEDLKKGELYFGLPASLLVLLLVFGAVVAGLVPLLLALVVIPVSIGIAALIGQLHELSFFLVNMVTAMGLALGIDYSLFVVSRYREERRAGVDRLDAVVTAGRTATVAVVFSGMSLTIALLGLLLVPDLILRSLAAGAMLVGVVAVAAALTLLPAVLSLLGDRVDALRIPFVHSAQHSGDSREGRFWRRLVGAVTRRPLTWLSATAGLLVALSVPVLGLSTGSAGVASLPDSVSKDGFLAIERSFPRGDLSNPARVVVDGDVAAAPVRTALEDLQRRLIVDPNLGPAALQVHSAQRIAVLDVPLRGDANSATARAGLDRLRTELVPATLGAAGASAYVTGNTAFTVDYSDLIGVWLPRVIAFVLVLTFLLLTLAFRSVVLPLKAVLLNLLSVGAAYGLLVLVFQHGIGAELLGLEQIATVEAWVPVFLFCVLFALSMDYHVFLLARIRERYAETRDTVDAVAHGIGSTGRIITGAALIIVVVFAGFATGQLVMFQQMGFGIGVALLLDATIVRSIVVPASMTLLGRWNWYLRSWLRWLPELQVEGRDVVPAAPAGAALPAAARAPSPP